MRVPPRYRSSKRRGQHRGGQRYSQVAIALPGRAERAAVERAEALREADKLKDALLASLSHDLRTPLTTIKGLAHELQTLGDERTLIIEEEADRLNRLVTDLLEVARLEGGALPLDIQINAADDLLGAVVQSGDSTSSTRCEFLATWWITPSSTLRRVVLLSSPAESRETRLFFESPITGMGFRPQNEIVFSLRSIARRKHPGSNRPGSVSRSRVGWQKPRVERLRMKIGVAEVRRSSSDFRR
ncbi:MAG: hypothetical protein DMD39_11310 [Gemmatimonadetes bacterium]|nr:MAG: hypothetical protein DMD39_11310 [Gemmatimonadota bacterium]